MQTRSFGTSEHHAYFMAYLIQEYDRAICARDGTREFSQCLTHESGL